MMGGETVRYDPPKVHEVGKPWGLLHGDDHEMLIRKSITDEAS